MHQTLLIITSILMSAFLAACAHMDKQDPMASLEHRAVAHWQAKQEKQWDGAYDDFCPAAKQARSKVDYIQSANLDITAFRITHIHIPEDGADAEVTIVFDAVMQGFPFKGIEIKERWRHAEYGWCLTPQGDFRDLFKKKQ